MVHEMEYRLSPRSDEQRAKDVEEAGAWLARLHNPDRTAMDHMQFLHWLQEPDKAAAFRLASDTWEIAGQLRRCAGTVTLATVTRK